MSEKMPYHIKENLKKDPKYYSLYNPENIIRGQNDPDYLGDLVVANEKLIWHSVHKYITRPEVIAATSGIAVDDILQLGRLGLLKAIKTFDVNKGFKFSSYGVVYIVREIKCFTRDYGGVIRLSRSAFDIACRIRSLEKKLGYLASAEEVSKILGINVGKVSKVMTVGGGIINYGMYSYVLDSNILSSKVEDDKLADEAVDKVYFESILKKIRENLGDFESDILRLSIVDGMTRSQIAQELGVPPVNVSRALKRIKKFLRHRTIV